MSTERVNLTLEDDVLEALDAFASDANMNRSRAANLLITASINGEGFEVVRKVSGNKVDPKQVRE